MPASLETSEIVRLLHEYEQLNQDGKDSGPTVAILARETQFPNVEQFLRSELLEKRRDVQEIAEWLTSHPPPPPAMTLGGRTFLGAIFGTAVGLSGLALAGFIWGGVNRVAPCHSAPDFLSGGLFGGMVLSLMYGLPVGAASCFLGAIIGAITRQPG